MNTPRERVESRVSKILFDLKALGDFVKDPKADITDRHREKIRGFLNAAVTFALEQRDEPFKL